jgi:hypothetical protein
MKFLFLFNIDPPKKFFCIPLRLLLIIIAIIATAFGIMSFCGILQFGGQEKDAYYYVIQAMGFISPILFIYTSCKKDSTTNYISLYFHTSYVLLIAILYVLLIIIFLIVSGTKYFEGIFLTSIIIQGVYILFTIFANFIFYAFDAHYDDIMEENEVRVGKDQVQTFNNENAPYKNIENN